MHNLFDFGPKACTRRSRVAIPQARINEKKNVKKSKDQEAYLRKVSSVSSKQYKKEQTTPRERLLEIATAAPSDWVSEQGHVFVTS